LNKIVCKEKPSDMTLKKKQAANAWERLTGDEAERWRINGIMDQHSSPIIAALFSFHSYRPLPLHPLHEDDLHILLF